MPPKSNPLRLNKLQLKTLTLFQELARHPETSTADEETGEVTISNMPSPHGNHFHIGDYVAMSADAIDHVMPWYAAFYASWERAMRLETLDCLLIAYEDMIADKPTTLLKVSEFLGLGKTLVECEAVVGKVTGGVKTTRLNKGVAGRGAEALTDDQKSRIRRLVEMYGTLDLERVGLA